MFPNLINTFYQITSPQTCEYNCIAWAAEDDTRWWWPEQGFYWPDQAPMDLNVRSFEMAYGTIGFQRSADGDLKQAYEKIALYVDASGTPTHAARQLPTGKWTSKLGNTVDIEHELIGLEGITYGRVAAFLKRRSIR